MTILELLSAMLFPKKRRQNVIAGFLIGVFWLIGLSSTASGNTQSKPVFGDYDAEPRIGNHVDTDLLVRRLVDLHANTYMWLIWHSSNDWEDLKVFLPKAKRAGITVWVYLVPHSETAIQNSIYPYSEPYRLDYIRWAEETARLSLQNSNLTGYVIDDFWENVCPNRFSPDYIRRMVAAGKAINPRLKFYPLMYFSEINYQFAEMLAPLVDGVVAAYPPDISSVDEALTFLQDRYTVSGSVTIVCPWNKPSKPGDHTFIVQRAEVKDPAHGQLCFHYSDNYDGPTTGYHRLQLKVDDQVVWDEDMGGHDNGVAIINLEKALHGKKTVKLSLGVFDARGVSNFGAEASFTNLKVRGLKLRDTDLGEETAWAQDTGPFPMNFVKKRVGKGQYRLPLIVMPAAEAEEYRIRHSGETPSPERIALNVKSLIGLVKQKRIEGIVTYCLDKQYGSKTFEAVRKIFRSAWK